MQYQSYNVKAKFCLSDVDCDYVSASKGEGGKEREERAPVGVRRTRSFQLLHVTLPSVREIEQSESRINFMMQDILTLEDCLTWKILSLSFIPFVLPLFLQGI